MREEIVTQLYKLSKPKLFQKNECICYEGQPGNEMYIILKGSIGVFVTSAIGTLIKVATLESGNFFGEMALFDDLPRSASCVALEDTQVVAITKDNLQEFLGTCPDIAKQMLENMSGRVRKVNDQLYKNKRFVNRHVPKFSLPAAYRCGTVNKKLFPNPKYLREYKQLCPICRKSMLVTDLKRSLLEEDEFGVDCRTYYKGVNPLWYEIISCPHCYYTNHYLKFFDINNYEFEKVKDIVRNEHRPILDSDKENRSDYDWLVLSYLQAIHINEHINAGGNVLIGGMWRNLYWLSQDASYKEFADYCALQAIEKYQAAMEENQFFDEVEKASIALTLVNLQIYCGTFKDASRYLDIAMACQDERITEHASKLKMRIEKHLQHS